MEALMVGTSLTDTRQSLKGFKVQDLPDHSKTKQCFPSNIIFEWKSSYDLGSFICASLELDKASTKADICSFGISDPIYLPSS